MTEPLACVSSGLAETGLKSATTVAVIGGGADGLCSCRWQQRNRLQCEFAVVKRDAQVSWRARKAPLSRTDYQCTGCGRTVRELNPERRAPTVAINRGASRGWSGSVQMVRRCPGQLLWRMRGGLKFTGHESPTLLRDHTEATFPPHAGDVRRLSVDGGRKRLWERLLTEQRRSHRCKTF